MIICGMSKAKNGKWKVDDNFSNFNGPNWYDTKN